MILVTGGSGFIGSHLIRYLLAHHYDVRAIFRNKKSTLLSAEEIKKVEWVKTDVLDIEQLITVMLGVDTVFHCASVVSFDARRRKELMQINVEGTANVVNAMLDTKVKTIVYLSSVAAIGRKEDSEIIREENEWEDSPMNSQYAVSKYEAEMEVWRGVAEGLQAIVVNPGIVLGEGDWNVGSCALFKRAYEEFPFYTKGVNAFVDVQDVVRAMVLLWEQQMFDQRFILSAGNFSYKDIFSLMARAFDKKAPQREAKAWMTALVWRWYELKKYFSSKEQTLTRETAKSAQRINEYDNRRLLEVLPQFKYTDMGETIDRSANYYSGEVGN